MPLIAYGFLDFHTTQGHSSGTASQAGLGGLAAEVGSPVPEVMRVGGSEHRGNIDFLSFAAAASQELEIDQSAGTLNEEIKRRPLVVRIFPNTAACLRLVRRRGGRMHENWIEAVKYLNMEYLNEHKRS